MLPGCQAGRELNVVAVRLPRGAYEEERRSNLHLRTKTATQTTMPTPSERASERGLLHPKLARFGDVTGRQLHNNCIKSGTLEVILVK